MRVTQVALRPTDASLAANRPALTPELLAATGARYSRSNEGLETILSRIDPENPDKSVDAIFRFIDYGHASIGDMAPVALFIDGVSMITAYLIWSLCPTAGGQESSTRYIRLDAHGVMPPELLGVPDAEVPAWREFIARSFAAYESALETWTRIAASHPERTRVPKSLREDSSDKARKAVARMERNYAFDRARYFLPVAAQTNLMLVQSARAWVGLCQNLLSHPWPEAQAVGAQIRDELALSAPRLLKHAAAKPSFEAGWRDEIEMWRDMARQTDDAAVEAAANATLEVLPPPDIARPTRFARALSRHDNRYAFIGSDLARMAVRFGWNAVSLAEIRDLNRHRTGTKYCPLVPQGFYAARDERPSANEAAALDGLEQLGRDEAEHARQLMSEGRTDWMAWTLLGTQFPFEHTTTVDKFIYQIELRTGVGSHYRYAQHMRGVAELWFNRFPETKGLIQIGSAEPE